MGILKFPDIVKLYTCTFLYEHLCDFKSTNLDFSYVFEQHNYNTRSAELQHLNVAPFRTNIRKFCPHVIECCFWNSIPLVIRQKPSMHSFKQSLYRYYVAQYKCSLVHIFSSMALDFVCVLWPIFNLYTLNLKNVKGNKGHLISPTISCPFSAINSIYLLFNPLYIYSGEN